MIFDRHDRRQVGRAVGGGSAVRRRSTRSSPSRVTATGRPVELDPPGLHRRSMRRMADLQGFMLPRSPEGRASIVPPPPWHYSGDVLTVEYRTAPGAVARWLPRGARAGRRGPRRRRADLGRLAVVRRGRGRAARPGALPVQGGVRRGAVPSRRRDVLAVRPDLGRQGLRARARLVPGLPEEARVDLDDPTRDGGPGGPAARARRPVRRDASRPTTAASPRSPSP